MKPITIVGLVLLTIMILAWFGVFDGLFDKDKPKQKKNKKKPVKVVKPAQVVKISKIKHHPLDENDEGDEGDDWGDDGGDWGDDGGDWGDDGGDWGDDGGDWGDDGGDWGDDGGETPEIIQIPPVINPVYTPIYTTTPPPAVTTTPLAPPVAPVVRQILIPGDWDPIPVSINQTTSPSVCSLRSAPIRDWGYESYRGWYDTENCGKKNRYCRWVGAADGPDPIDGTIYDSDYGLSRWMCSTATDQYGYHPATWDANYLKSDTEQY